MLVAALLLALFSPAVTMTAAEAQNDQVARIAGPDRVATSLAIGLSLPTPADTLILARADDFPDGLAGGPLAAAGSGPLVLTAPDSLSPAVAEALPDLVKDGGTVVVLGGPAAIAPAIVRDLEVRGLTVNRLSGSTRAATAVAIADALADKAGSPDHVFIASGQGFADALSASAVAGARREPVLLTTPDRLSPEVAAWLETRRPDRVTVVGGPVAVGDAVLTDIEELGLNVTRAAGPDRWATSAVIATRFAAPMPQGSDAMIASGASWPDALAGAPFAAHLFAPILLVGDNLPEATRQVLLQREPGATTLFGGESAVSAAVERRITEAVGNDPASPALVASAPADGEVMVSVEAGVVLTFTESVETASVSASIDGNVRAATATIDGQTVQVTVDVADDELAGRDGLVLDLTVDVRASGSFGRVTTTHDIVIHDPVYARASGIELHEPSASIDLIGFHQANHDGARLQTVNDNGLRTVVMSSRGRNTGLTSAADIVAEPGVAIVAPTTGRVLRGGSYTLYCRYTDNFLVIEPDGFPGFEVKLLHFQGLTVRAGDHVVAGETVIGSGPTQLPFESQVDEHSSTGWPHVHLEVVDTSIPDKPNSGSGSDGC